MATRKPAIAQVLEPIENGDDGPTAAEQEAAQLAQTMQQLGLNPSQHQEYLGPPPELAAREDAYITVFRIDRDSKRRVYCCQYAPAEFNLERLRRDKGGGYFWIRLIARNPNNGNRPAIYWQDFTELEGAPIHDAPIDPAKPALASAAGQAAPDITAQLMQAMMVGFERLAVALKASAPAPLPPPTRREMLDELQIMADLFRQKPQHNETPLGMVKEIFEVVRTLQPPDAESSPAGLLISTAERVLPMIGDIIARAPRAAPPTAAAAPALPAPTPATPAQVPAATHPGNGAEDVGALETIKFRMGLKFLCDAAKDDEDATIYADMVLSKIAPEQVQEFVGRADWLEFLTGHLPEVGNYAAWFGELRAAILEALEADGTLTGGGEPGTSGPIQTH